MITVRSVAELRGRLSALRDRGKSVGLVPTMGALHDGHAELLRRARSECDIVVLSIFVNPAQFDDASDLAAYPRDEAADLRLAERLGVDVAFLPEVAEVYPPGFGASIALSGPLVDQFEGAVRGVSHFAGVTTVVGKLFNMVGPDRAYFGQKDAQQLRVVRRMVRDLDLDVDVVAVPTVREQDGLARSSRNVRLSAAARQHAVSLSQGLLAAQQAVAAGVRDAGVLIDTAAGRLDPHLRVEYLACVDDQSFLPVDTIDRPAVLVAAVVVDGVRLIDNVLLEVGPAPSTRGARRPPAAPAG